MAVMTALCPPTALSTVVPESDGQSEPERTLWLAPATENVEQGRSNPGADKLMPSLRLVQLKRRPRR